MFVIIHMRIIPKTNYFAWCVRWSEIWWRLLRKSDVTLVQLNGYLENYMYLESTTKLLNYAQPDSHIIVLSTVESLVKSIEAT